MQTEMAVPTLGSGLATGGLSTAKWNGGGLPVLLRHLCQQAVGECRPSLVLCSEKSTSKKSGRFSGTSSTVLS